MILDCRNPRIIRVRRLLVSVGLMSKIVILLCLCLLPRAILAQTEDYTRFVNPFIGTQDTGHTFPGASAPFGLMQPSPDTNNAGWAYASGYQYADRSIMGFSNTHLNGTGVPDLGDILLQPFSGNAVREDYRSRFRKTSEKAAPGYYAVFLDDFKVRVELTASERVAVHRYSYETDEPQRVLLDLQHGLVWADASKRVLASDVKIENDQTVSGSYTAENWVRRKVFFVVAFDKPFVKSQQLHARANEKAPRFVLDFDLKTDEILQAKVAVSTVSVEAAKNNLAAEVPGWNFDRVRAQTAAKWNELLGRVQIKADDNTKTIFYTALYHLFLQPNNIADVSGEYRAANDQIRRAKQNVYYSTFSLWDTFRAAHPLYTVLAPEQVDGFVNSLLGHADATGFLPIWTLWDQETATMIGNHSLSVIADADQKGFRGFDRQQAFRAMRRTATVSHKNSEWETYLKYGYYPFDITTGNEAQPVSRTLEATVGDAAVAQMAASAGDKIESAEFARRALFYRNVFDPETKLMRGRDSKGNWRTPFDPLAATSPLRNPGDYTEANAWQYSFAAQHDIPGLIELHGGKANFARALDTFFSVSAAREADDTHTKFLGQEGLIGQYAHGNEPSHHIAYLYKYTDKGWRADELVREITRKFYRNAPDGITGNEDCGQMSAWYIFSMLGFYPVHPSNGEYVLGAPQIERATLRLAGGKALTVTAKNFSPANRYVQAVRLNGRQIKKRSISHRELTGGGALEFVMTNNR